ncbi:hypothetical protein FIBSPDRAFT_1041365 [Athelia psychrophila]|uniref:Secreted protein n=1 Tax=Athelia psychrophila TaxID=1759441 RepID=A0A166NYY0_9AGAM|nr:hypothetical protein FIBSPDRAFT_1041365 [Fibularhizoctonia sp. CBS 109695]
MPSASRFGLVLVFVKVWATPVMPRPFSPPLVPVPARFMTLAPVPLESPFSFLLLLPFFGPASGSGSTIVPREPVQTGYETTSSHHRICVENESESLKTRSRALVADCIVAVHSLLIVWHLDFGILDGIKRLADAFPPLFIPTIDHHLSDFASPPNSSPRRRHLDSICRRHHHHHLATTSPPPLQPILSTPAAVLPAANLKMVAPRDTIEEPRGPTVLDAAAVTPLHLDIDLVGVELEWDGWGSEIVSAFPLASSGSR